MPYQPSMRFSYISTCDAMKPDYQKTATMIRKAGGK